MFKEATVPLSQQLHLHNNSSSASGYMLTSSHLSKVGAKFHRGRDGEGACYCYGATLTCRHS